MLSSEQVDQLAPFAKKIQIVSIAMFFGTLVFLGVICALVDFDRVHTKIPMLVLIGALSAIAMYAMSFFFFQFFSSSTKIEPKSDEGISSAAGVFMTSNVLRYAMLEGGCFLNALVFFLEAGLVNLIVACFGIFLMLVVFPTHQRIVDTVGDLVK